jgi:hypothetical protein
MKISFGKSTLIAGLSLVALLLTACPADEIVDPVPDTSVDVVQTECDYDAQCEGTEVASCQIARCVAGTCTAVQDHLWAPCDRDDLGVCERGGCNESGTCVAIGAEDGTVCQNADWSACSGYTCQNGACAESNALDCNDNNPCTDDTCDAAAGGCVHANNTAGCDDSNACTGGDTCSDGLCLGPENLCQCTNDADCDAFDDGDKCNGVMVCDVDNQLCVPLEGSAVVCDTDADPDCKSTACNPATGQCELSNNEDYSVCSDGEPCTGCAPGDAACNQFDYCSAGECQAGLGTPCECEASEDCLALDDGNICNGGWICNAGTCEIDPESVVDCSGQVAPQCGAIACNPNNGACEVIDGENGTVCDDENVCTEGDSCLDGVCQAGETNACSCEANEDCAAFDDGDTCNGVWTCQDSSCAFDEATVLGDADADGVCDDADVCNGDDASGDSDGDMTCDDLDACDNDIDKSEEGVCGCGVADTDTDTDGTADCNDACIEDADKTEAGQCGCGVADTDTDTDGTADCNDACVDDALKTEAGACGCGVADTDTDSDGTADCNDACVDDSLKVAEGVCGCGVSDIDTDEDGTADCNDVCLNDPAKTDAGVCGCGIPDTDTDEDGTADCQDQCPSNGTKTEPGACGCGFDKAEPGTCGCDTPDDDADDNGIIDCLE